MLSNKVFLLTTEDTFRYNYKKLKTVFLGIKTELLLSQAQNLFPKQNIDAIVATTYGVSDTTYIAYSDFNPTILKKYEQAGQAQIQEEKKLLTILADHSLKVPVALASSKDWQLFSYLKGASTENITLRELTSVASFLAKFHQITRLKKHLTTPFSRDLLLKEVKTLRQKDLIFSKKFSSLKNFPKKYDGVIHGDLFPDNAKFYKGCISVFDFIQAGNGSFSFDLGVVAMSWMHDKKLSVLKMKLFLQAYNQHSFKKIKLTELITMMKYASLVYALRRYLHKPQALNYKEMMSHYRNIIRFEQQNKRLLAIK